MDERSKNALNKILGKTVEELHDHEIRFLRARRSYLTLTDKKKFTDILLDKKEEPKKKNKK